MKILFVNPDQKLFQIYQPHLKRHFLVDSADNGLSALRKLRLSPPSLVVSEYTLPWFSGLTLLKFMRKDGRYAAIPFIFLTDHDNSPEALSSGANDWLSKKQTHPDFLLAKIYSHLKLNPYGL
jgi:DNA-binding response OmpR family regulator